MISIFSLFYSLAAMGIVAAISLYVCLICLLFMYDLTLLMGNMIRPRYGLLTKGLFHKSPELFGPFSGASIAFLSSQRCGSKQLKSCHPPRFFYIKNMLKDQLVKTSAFQFDNWVFGPEMFLGLSRPQICIMGEIFGVRNKSLATFIECQPF